MFQEALRIAKGLEEDKVTFSLRVPARLKHQFDELCSSNNISINQMIVSLMSVAVMESDGRIKSEENDSTLFIVRKIEQLQEEADSYEIVLNNGGRHVKDEYGNEIDVQYKLDHILIRIKALEAELQKRSQK